MLARRVPFLGGGAVINSINMRKGFGHVLSGMLAVSVMGTGNEGSFSSSSDVRAIHQG